MAVQCNRTVDGLSALTNTQDQIARCRVRMGLPGEQIPGKFRVLQVKQALERRLLRRRGRGGMLVEPAFEEHIELLHAAPAPPAQPSEAAQVCSRSAIIFLISAMALAGLRSFGQASVQFMIVWQR